MSTKYVSGFAMSAQCWCFNCAGRVVCRKTYRAHGRKDKPYSPTSKRARICRPPPSPPPAAGFAFDEAVFVEPELLDPLALMMTSSDAVRAAGFDTESLVDTVIVHVDTIAHKLMLLPHFTDNSKLIVIRTHETR